jgi:hypothetical protein
MPSMWRYAFAANYIQPKDNNYNKGAEMYIDGRPKVSWNLLDHVVIDANGLINWEIVGSYVIDVNGLV